MGTIQLWAPANHPTPLSLLVHFQDVTPGTGSCVSDTGVPKAANYIGWFGFDSIPVINKSARAVRDYFLTA